MELTRYSPKRGRGPSPKRDTMSSRKEWSVAWDWCETSDGLVGEICLREYPRRTDPLKVRFLWSADSAPENLHGPVLAVLNWALDHSSRLIVESPVTRALLESTRAVQEFCHYWYPEQLHPFAIDATVAPDRLALNQNLFRASSRGIDASHSALRHSQQGSGMSNRIIRELLFVHGADIPFSNESSAAIAIALARESAQYLGAVLRC